MRRTREVEDGRETDETRSEIACTLSPGELKAHLENERQCCRFLRFVLTLEPETDQIRLEVTGPGSTREFLASIIESSA